MTAAYRYVVDGPRTGTYRDGIPVDIDQDVPNRADGIAYLTPDLDPGHGDTVPCSRYGTTGRDCAPVAWRVAYLVARETGSPVTYRDLDYAMGLVVNDMEDVAHVVRTYGRGHYR